MESTTVTLGGLTTELVDPDLFDADALMAAMPDSTLPPATHHGRRLAVLAGALALCWPLDLRWPGDFRPTPFAAADNPLSWGKQAYSSLRRCKISEAKIVEAGIIAVRKVQSTRYSQEEIDSAVGNSEDRGVASSG